MTDLYRLPTTAVIDGCEYGLNTDFRVILQIFQCFEETQLPEVLRWRVALGLFYDRPVAPEHRLSAMVYLSDFISCGRQEETAGVKLLDWQQDAQAVIAGVNKAAGCEVRMLEHVHWWTFLGWFHAMEPGQLSTVISIRDKLRRGKKLEDWEKEFYRQNRRQVDLKRQESPEELAYKQRLNKILGD